MATPSPKKSKPKVVRSGSKPAAERPKRANGQAYPPNARRCTALVKKGPRAGERCSSYKAPDAETCVAHLPKPEAESRGFGGSENGVKGGQMNKRKSFRAIFEEKMEQEADALIEQLREIAFDAQRAVVVPGSADGKVKGRIEFVDDTPLQFKSTAYLVDQLMGKPSNRIEGSEGGPVEVDLTPSETKALAIAEAMREAGLT